MYEHVVDGKLVAVSFEDSKRIKKYFKSKSDSNESVPGYAFVVDGETGALRIDFSESLDFEIRNLSKADLK